MRGIEGVLYKYFEQAVTPQWVLRSGYTFWEIAFLPDNSIVSTYIHTYIHVHVPVHAGLKNHVSLSIIHEYYGIKQQY